jgi:hypothetical protein
LGAHDNRSFALLQMPTPWKMNRAAALSRNAGSHTLVARSEPAGR